MVSIVSIVYKLPWADLINDCLLVIDRSYGAAWLGAGRMPRHRAFGVLLIPGTHAAEKLSGIMELYVELIQIKLQDSAEYKTVLG